MSSDARTLENRLLSRLPETMQRVPEAWGGRRLRPGRANYCQICAGERMRLCPMRGGPDDPQYSPGTAESRGGVAQGRSPHWIFSRDLAKVIGVCVTYLGRRRHANEPKTSRPAPTQATCAPGVIWRALWQTRNIPQALRFRSPSTNRAGRGQESDQTWRKQAYTGLTNRKNAPSKETLTPPGRYGRPTGSLIRRNLGESGFGCAPPSPDWLVGRAPVSRSKKPRNCHPTSGPPAGRMPAGGDAGRLDACWGHKDFLSEWQKG